MPPPAPGNSTATRHVGRGRSLTPRLTLRCSARRRDASSAVNTGGLLGMLSPLLRLAAARDSTDLGLVTEGRCSTLSCFELELDRDMRRSSDWRICLNCAAQSIARGSASTVSRQLRFAFGICDPMPGNDNDEEAASRWKDYVLLPYMSQAAR